MDSSGWRHGAQRAGCAGETPHSGETAPESHMPPVRPSVKKEGGAACEQCGKGGAGCTCGDRVTLWNTKELRKISGNAAPSRANLDKYLQSHPGMEVYTGQDQLLDPSQRSAINSRERRVKIWDPKNKRVISGNAAPLERNLAKYLKKNPGCEVYAYKPHQQKAVMKPFETATSGSMRGGEDAVDHLFSSMAYQHDSSPLQSWDATPAQSPSVADMVQQRQQQQQNGEPTVDVQATGSKMDLGTGFLGNYEMKMEELLVDTNTTKTPVDVTDNFRLTQVKQFIDSRNSGRGVLARPPNLFHPDLTYRDNNLGTHTGDWDAISSHWRGFYSALDSPMVNVVNMRMVDRETVGLDWSMSGRHVKPLFGVPPLHDNPIHVKGTGRYRFRGDRMIEVEGAWSGIAVMQQIMGGQGHKLLDPRAGILPMLPPSSPMLPALPAPSTTSPESSDSGANSNSQDTMSTNGSSVGSERSDESSQMDRQGAQLYLCDYCGATRPYASTTGDGRVRIRCDCGGKHQDGKSRMHASWQLLTSGAKPSVKPSLKTRVRSKYNSIG